MAINAKVKRNFRREKTRNHGDVKSTDKLKMKMGKSKKLNASLLGLCSTIAKFSDSNIPINKLILLAKMIVSPDFKATRAKK